MKKSKTVSYTSDELKQRQSQTDWDAVANMTDEEIEAAIASDPEEAAMNEGWMERARVIPQQVRFVTPSSGKRKGQMYKVLPGAKKSRGYIGVVDTKGNIHFLSPDNLVAVEDTQEAERLFAQA